MTASQEPTEALKLLYAINGLGTGGAERSLAELLPYYLAGGIRPVIACVQRREEGVEAAVRRLGCDIRFLPGGGALTRARALRAILEQERMHLVHTTLFDSDIAGRLAAMGTGVPVLSSVVNTSYEPVRLRDPNVSRAGLLACRAIDGWTARHLTTHFHAITEAVKASAVRSLGILAERVTVVERGRAPERLGSPDPERRRAARCRLGLADDNEVIINVARQEYQKGQKYLLHAAGILAVTRPRLVVLVAGREGHASRELLELSERLQLGDRLRFLGHRDEVPELLAAADVFAFPSLYEGFGGAVVEAMALGLPIVASDLPTLREVVEDGGSGLLVKPESSAALAAAIARLLDDHAMASAFGRRGREIFQKRFTVGRSAERMIDLYHRVVDMSGRHRRRSPRHRQPVRPGSSEQEAVHPRISAAHLRKFLRS
jgi:glycosyltransferase involved in cell wall biosynthesis